MAGNAQEQRGLLLAALVAGGFAALLSMAPAVSRGAEPAAQAVNGNQESGRVAWYGKRFAGRRTSSGQRFNPGALTMAHRALPFGTRVKVTNVANGRSVVVRVNDRGPTQNDRVGDLSRAAAKRIGMLRSGVVDAELEVLGQ